MSIPSALATSVSIGTVPPTAAAVSTVVALADLCIRPGSSE